MRQLETMDVGSEQTTREALAAGDDHAYHSFVIAHRPAMLRLAGEMLGNGDVAEEVVQDTFEAIFKDVGAFRGEASLKTWSYRILVNRARRVGKRENRTVPFTYFDNFGIESHPSRGEDPQTAAINRQRVRFLAEGLRRLPDRQREIVVLRDIEGRDTTEVSELLDITPGNQRVLLHRGRAALRSGLELRDSDGADSSHAGPLLN
jgi:RNA polymerase sigma-70 factor (ECF subfamily)